MNMHPADEYNHKKYVEYLEQCQRWLAIKTAPRDGTPILLFIKSHGIVEGWFAKGEWQPCYDSSNSRGEYIGAVWVCAEDAFECEVEEYPDGYNDGQVTHWMPLPEAPK